MSRIWQGNNSGFIQTISKYVEQLNFALEKKEVWLSLLWWANEVNCQSLNSWKAETLINFFRTSFWNFNRRKTLIFVWYSDPTHYYGRLRSYLWSQQEFYEHFHFSKKLYTVIPWEILNGTRKTAGKIWSSTYQIKCNIRQNEWLLFSLFFSFWIMLVASLLGIRLTLFYIFCWQGFINNLSQLLDQLGILVGCDCSTSALTQQRSTAGGLKKCTEVVKSPTLRLTKQRADCWGRYKCTEAATGGPSPCTARGVKEPLLQGRSRIHCLNAASPHPLRASLNDFMNKSQ
jgi:hypothetical protein